jgi:hypothetical protein
MTVLATYPIVETPLAPVTVAWSARNRYWAVLVEHCPFCQGKHYHGGGDGPEAALGARVAHCGKHDGGYELVETASSIAARTLPHGYIGPGCAVEVGPGRRSRCSGCAS